MEIVLVIVISYLIGSFPTAIIAGRILKGIDIRLHGSGNAGATNVFRVLGWKAGLGVLLIDMLKGFIPVFWIAGMLSPSSENVIYFQIIAAITAIIGHMWTIFAGFKGGKGVGTSAGVFIALAPVPLLGALLSFVLVVAVWRYVSLGSLVAALVFLIIMLIQKYVFNLGIPLVLLALVICVVILIWIAHRQNIQRLINGTENKINFGSAKQKSQ